MIGEPAEQQAHRVKLLFRRATALDALGSFSVWWLFVKWVRAGLNFKSTLYCRIPFVICASC